MAWHRPGRNANHPGDPPPRWATLSRGQRLALLLTVIAGVTLALVLRVTGVAGGLEETLIQEPSHSPTVPQEQAEISGSGFVVTFPQGWIIETRYGTQLHGVSPDGSAWCFPSGQPIPEPVDDLEALLDDVAAIFPVFSEDEPMPIIETSEVELPAGRAVRFISDYALDDGLAEDYGARFVTTYILTDGRTLLILGCSAAARPDDDWQSVAESVEFVPEEE